MTQPTASDMTPSERRAALRQLIIAFGLINKTIELSARGAPRQVAEHAEAARDLIGELVADLAR
ncbi:hypothetical protein [Nocardia rosealba]|uniref:hypothetical protein n=1 Tax=Nocardia rosealba TaxID=2878563 RepID=UPI001CD9ACA4|nr:hypothetical protein [Nocardia rosealba]MCA2206059.1 hypothetical protein [Nocardia rosealba]